MTPSLPPPQLAELFDRLDDVHVWIKDRQGRYCWVNRAFLLSYAADHPEASGTGQEILGKTDYEISPVFLADQFRLDDELVLAGNRIVNRIELVGRPDGQTGWNVTNKIPYYDAKGIVVGTVGMTRWLNSSEVNTGDGFGPVLTFMRDHYHEAVTNRQLARLACLSVRAFERKFKAGLHLTPQKYLRKFRLRMASRGLIFSHRTIVEIALSCGFADQSHFTREFRRLFGRTPREYREYYGSTRE